MLILGVVGAGSCPPATESLAYEVGHEIAARGAALVCGGLGGVMQAACRGAREAGGVTIGIIPGTDARDANPFVDHVIVTGMGDARNVILVRTAACLIAVSGAYGTLSELAYALKLGVPVVGLRTWELTLPGTAMSVPIEPARDAHQAVDLALQRVAERSAVD